MKFFLVPNVSSHFTCFLFTLLIRGDLAEPHIVDMFFPLTYFIFVFWEGVLLCADLLPPFLGLNYLKMTRGSNVCCFLSLSF